jgi:hypothetical protein
MLAPLSARIPWRTRWVIVLLIVAVGSAAYGLAEIAHGLDAALVLTIVMIAIGLGWVMATGPISGRIALALASLTGIAVLTVRIGHIGSQLVAIPAELVEFMVESIRLQEIAPAEPLVAAVSELLLDLGVLYGRLWLWLGTFATEQWTEDPVASAFVWSTLIWGTTVWAAWAVRRRREPIAAVLPILTLLGISYAISRGRPSSFVIPLGSTLLLMAFASHEARAHQWNQDGIDSPEGKTSSLAIIVLPIALFLTGAAALTQSFSLIRIVNVFDPGGARDDRALADSLGLARGGAAETGLESVLIPGLPNRHLIGSGPELSEQVVMEITVANLPIEEPTPGFRWRALTYDQYQGRGWQTSSLILEDLAAGELIDAPESPSDLVVRQWIRVIGEMGGLAYSAGNPAVLDQEVEVAWRDTGRDAFALTIGKPLYQVESIVSQASQTELRAVGTEYPDWVRETYLTLPEDVPDRVLALGRDLTATSATPYDRALAIETYLRAIPYTLDVPEPPLDRDVVDYFLFDLQKGYCDYYASSMVVLARAAGIPARLVVGYFSGTPQQTEGTIRYVVTEAEAHSWVEVYFPEIGWVEFDPTGGRAAIERKQAAPALTSSETPRLELAQRPSFTIRGDVPVLVGGSIIGLAVAGLTWVMFLDPLQLQRRAPGEALLSLYERLRRLTTHLDIESSPGDTPYEFQAALLDSLEDGSPRIRERARDLIGAHVQAAYAKGSVDRALSARHIRAWRSLSFRLWLERIKRFRRLS